MSKIEIKLLQKEIKQLLLGGYFASKNTTMPILKCIKCRITDNELFVKSTDLSNTINIKIKLTNPTDDCDFCIDINEIRNVLNSIDDECVTLAIYDKAPDMLYIEHNHGKMKIPIMDSSTFPNIEQDEILSDITLETNLILPILLDATYFVCTDQLRMQMCGVNIKTSYDVNTDKTLVVVNSTDAQRLYQNKIYIDNLKNEDNDIIINTDAIKSLNIFAADSESIELQISQKNINFILNDEVKISSRLIDGKYPNVEAAIPKDMSIFANLNPKEILSSLQRISNCASNSTYTIGAKFKHDELELNAEDLDFSKQAIDKIPCECNDEITIGINLKYLSQILSLIKHEDKVQFQLTNPRRAVVIKEDTEVYKDSNLILMIMPVLLTTE